MSPYEKTMMSGAVRMLECLEKLYQIDHLLGKGDGNTYEELICNLKSVIAVFSCNDWDVKQLFKAVASPNHSVYGMHYNDSVNLGKPFEPSNTHFYHVDKPMPQEAEVVIRAALLDLGID